MSCPWVTVASVSGIPSVGMLRGVFVEGSVRVECLAALRSPFGLLRGDLGGPVTGHRVVGELLAQGFDSQLRVGEHRDGSLLDRVELCDVDRDEAHIGILEHRLRSGGEVGQLCADADDDIGLGDEAVGRGVALSPMPPSTQSASVSAAPLPPKVSATGMPVDSANAASASRASE